MQFLIDNFERKLFVTSVTHQLLLILMLELRNMHGSPKCCDCGNIFEICLQPPILIKFRFQ